MNATIEPTPDSPFTFNMTFKEKPDIPVICNYTSPEEKIDCSLDLEGKELEKGQILTANSTNFTDSVTENSSSKKENAFEIDVDSYKHYTDDTSILIYLHINKFLDYNLTEAKTVKVLTYVTEVIVVNQKLPRRKLSPCTSKTSKKGDICKETPPFVS